MIAAWMDRSIISKKAIADRAGSCVMSFLRLRSRQNERTDQLSPTEALMQIAEVIELCVTWALHRLKKLRSRKWACMCGLILATACVAPRKQSGLRSLDQSLAQIAGQEEALKVFYDLVEVLGENVYKSNFDNPELVGEKLADLDKVAKELGLVNTTGLRFEFKAKRLARSASENPFDLLGSWSQLKQLPVGNVPLVSNKISQIAESDPEKAGQIWKAADNIAEKLWTQPFQPLEDNLFSRLAAAEAPSQESFEPTAGLQSVIPLSASGGLEDVNDSGLELSVTSLAGRDTKGKPGSIPVTRTEYRFNGMFHSPAFLAELRKAKAEGVKFERAPETIKIRVRNYYDAEYSRPLMTAANIAGISMLLPDFAQYPVRFWEFKTTDGKDPQEAKNAVRVRKYRLPVYSHDVRILANETALQYALDQSTNQPVFSQWARENPETGRHVESLVRQVLNDRADIVKAVAAAGAAAQPGQQVSLVKALLARPSVATLFKNPYKPDLPLLSLVDSLNEQPQGKNLLQRFSDFVSTGAASAQRMAPGYAQQEREAMLRWVRGFQARAFVLSMWHADFLKTSAFNKHKNDLLLSRDEAQDFDIEKLTKLRPALIEVARQSLRWSRQMTLTTAALFDALNGPNAFPTQYIMQYKRLSFEVEAKGPPGSDMVYPVQITLDRDIELRSPIGTRLEMPFKEGVYFDDLDMAFPPKMVVAEVKFPDGSQYGLDGSPQMKALYWYRDQVLSNRVPESRSTAGKNYVAAEVLEGPVGKVVRAWDFLRNSTKYLQLGYADYQFDEIKGVSRSVTNLMSFAPLWQKTAKEFCTLVGEGDERLLGRDIVECVAPDRPL